MPFHFILVEPAVSGNIGAAARALKTMGQHNLMLVNPAPHFNDEAKMFGHGSWDVLEQASLFTSLESAISDMDFVIGTSAKNRSVKHDYFPMEEIGNILEQKKESVANVALVFGREESGLTNQELHQCDIITYIPMISAYPSLNLGQAVMLYSYYIHSLESSLHSVSHSKSVDYRIVKNKSTQALNQLGIHSENPLHNRIMERIALLGGMDLHLLLSVCNRILEK
jgi:tRNA/rRNA methyltransferase